MLPTSVHYSRYIRTACVRDVAHYISNRRLFRTQPTSNRRLNGGFCRIFYFLFLSDFFFSKNVKPQQPNNCKIRRVKMQTRSWSNKHYLFPLRYDVGRSKLNPDVWSNMALHWRSPQWEAHLQLVVVVKEDKRGYAASHAKICSPVRLQKRRERISTEPRKNV